MAIKIQGSEIISDNRDLVDINTLNGTTVGISKPNIASPSDGATDISESPTITSSSFSVSIQSDTHASTDWQIATDSNFTNIIFESLDDTSNLESITVPSDTLLEDTQHYVRVRYTGATLGDSDYSDTVSFLTSEIFVTIDTPSITSPSDGAPDIGTDPTITSSAFSTTGGSDTHESSDWQIATDSNFTNIIFESLDDTSNLESITTSLDDNTTYYVRVRHTGTNVGDSDYSAGVEFTVPPVGEASFTTPGTYSWTAPSGVNSVSAVCIGPGFYSNSGGGGSLGWANNISVQPGSSYTVVVGEGNTSTDSYFLSPSTVRGSSGDGFGSDFVGDGGGKGGESAGGYSSGTGAGGYSGNGGDQPDAYNRAGLDGSGGAGGSGGSSGATANSRAAGGGGGVGLFGEGPSGSGGSGDGIGGGGGSGGGDGGNGGFGGTDQGGAGGLYGGGGGRIDDDSSGADGAVRIIFGPGRSFPNDAG